MDQALKAQASKNQGRVIWITGLSGSGKTTLARALRPLLPPPALILDGDELRLALSLLAGGYGREERINLALTYARLAALMAGQGQTVICSTISMFHQVRDWNRQNLPGYFEVFVDPPAEVLRQRDYKQVYGEAASPAAQVMGQDLAPEFPRNSDLHLTDPGLSPDQAAALIAERLARPLLQAALP